MSFNLLFLITLAEREGFEHSVFPSFSKAYGVGVSRSCLREAKRQPALGHLNIT